MPIKRSDCHGCHDEFYQERINCTGVGCWSFKDAKKVRRKKVSIHTRPPYHEKTRWYPNCYHAAQYVMVDP